MQWEMSKGLEGLEHNFLTGTLETFVLWARRRSWLTGPQSRAPFAIRYTNEAKTSTANTTISARPNMPSSSWITA
jgi:hypothetical protein